MLPSKKDRDAVDDQEVKDKEPNKKLTPIDTETKLKRQGGLAGGP